MSRLAMFLMQFCGAPYIYNTNGPWSFDCSALIADGLRHVKVLPNRDFSAQMIYNYLDKNEALQSSNLRRDVVLFFGPDTDNIEHVALAVNDYDMIEAGGGDSTTLTIEEARKRNAMVRITNISRRSDLIAAIKITY